LQYDSTWKKVAAVQIKDSAADQGSTWTKFTYDRATGDLTQVANSAGSIFSLLHNDRGLISNISGADGENLALQYNSASDLTDIVVKLPEGHAGNVHVEYNLLGEVAGGGLDSGVSVSATLALLQRLQLEIAAGLVSGRDCDCPDPTELGSNEVKTIDRIIDVVERVVR
jgi:hypothetical protein